jgi:SAM-dependent methyltransferase/uncharacterized membrane protein YbhN (UPF0104 family)
MTRTAAQIPRLSRPARLTLGCLSAVAIVGLVATIDGFARAGGFPDLSPRLLAVAPLAAGATIANLMIRFVRWQFLLRHLDVRLPTIAALGSFVGSFAFLPIPFYVGHLTARVWLLDLPAAAVPRVVIAFALEQLLNVWALAVLILAAAGHPGTLLVLAAAAAVAAVPMRRAVLRLLGRATAPIAGWLANRPDDDAPRELPMVGAGVLAVAAALSLVAWALVAAVVLPLVWAAGGAVEPLAGIAAASRAILVGAVSLIPLGASVAGTALFAWLQDLGVSPAAAADTVLVFRAGTTWLSVALGGAAVLALRRNRARAHTHDHFDAIDECYDAWLPPHYRDHLVERKTAPMIARLPALGRNPHGLDIGCGRGWYAARVRAHGARLTGLDTSARQLVAARDHLGGDVPLVRGSALDLPFAADTFDFAYVINVLHHVATPPEQRDAVAEIGRVVRPGGLVFVHEMSVRNPLFRIYLEYVYPITKGIEEGVEYYLDPRRLTDVPGLRLLTVEHFTFVPDFAPRAILPWLARIERRLEASRLAPWAAHFLAVYERLPAHRQTLHEPAGTASAARLG